MSAMLYYCVVGVVLGIRLLSAETCVLWLCYDVYGDTIIVTRKTGIGRGPLGRLNSQYLTCWQIPYTCHIR